MKRNKILDILIMLLLTISVINGCGAAEESLPENNLSGEAVDLASSDKPEKGSMDAYKLLLSGTKDEEELYRFIGDNIEDYEEPEADQLIISLIDFSGDVSQVDYSRLAVCMDDVSPEMYSFLRMMQTEQENLGLPQGENPSALNELLEQVITAEDHMKKYPDGLTEKYAWERYTVMMNAALTGGYDKKASTPNAYVDEEGCISDAVVEEYRIFTEEYECTSSAAIVKEYLGILKLSSNKVSTEAENFYRNIPEKIKDAFNL